METEQTTSKPEQKNSYINQIRNKVTDYTSSKVSGIKDETVGVLKDFSTKEGILENSKKMHPFRVFAMVFMIFTLVLNVAATIFTVINGFTSGHSYLQGTETLSVGASFHAEPLLAALCCIIFSLIYLIRVYNCKSLTWIPVIFVPITTYVSLFFVSNNLSWYGLGADIAKGCADFAAILSLPPVVLELSVTGQTQKAGKTVQKFFNSLKENNTPMPRIIAIGMGFLTIVVQIMGLAFIGVGENLQGLSVELALSLFAPLLLILVLYILFSKRHYKFSWIPPILFVAVNYFVDTGDFRNTALVTSSLMLVLEIIVWISKKRASKTEKSA